jgi:shikimate kinase
MLARSGKPLLFLIGLRGSGKTAVAKVLAERLGCPVCDADALLEQRAGKTIREIFAEEGESGFRDRESAILREIAGRRDRVVATGGGVVLRPENCALLRRGHVVWLHASPAVLWQRIQADTTTADRRPNLAQGGLAEVEALLAARTALYEGCAELRIDTDDASPEVVAERILAWLRVNPATGSQSPI